MAYQINIEVNGFELSFGEMGLGHKIGLFIDFQNENIKQAIEESDPLLTEAIQIMFNNHELLDAQYMMDNFEYYYLQGHGWDSLMESYSFKGLSDFKQKAELVLANEEHTSDHQRDIAKTLLDTLNGNPPRYERPEKTPEEKAKATFDRKKPKLRTKLVIRDGYKCDNCGTDKEDSLCVIQKEAHNMNYELENLALRCRSCMTKLRNKK
tara:strand:+ start:10871 stop:11497 length:627 start_codon:yes stop_codon:yes gene_type:complete